MKRRKLIQYSSASLLTSIVSSWSGVGKTATNDSLTVEWLGHMSFLFIGSGQRILVNPFQTLGCTALYRLPLVEADLVLMSSRLLDEGAALDFPGNPELLIQSGFYEIDNLQIQGISIPHDREGGRRFGINVAWRWIQSGIKILHLGGAAAPIQIEERILMGSPDLLLIPVGGGPKAYNPQEAMAAIQVLKPKMIIPTQYLTEAADLSNCDLVPVEEFLALAEDMKIQKINSNKITWQFPDLPSEGTVITVLSTDNILQNS